MLYEAWLILGSLTFILTMMSIYGWCMSPYVNKHSVDGDDIIEVILISPLIFISSFMLPIFLWFLILVQDKDIRKVTTYYFSNMYKWFKNKLKWVY